MQTSLEPRLAPPGAGLPAVELLVARGLFRLRRFVLTREAVTRRFGQERDRLRFLLGGLDAPAAGRRVLITRVRGLEDSSRYWSVWMTLDHLRIVHRAITGVLGALGRGVVPPGTASTAAVKPNPEVTAEVVEAFEASCDTLLDAASRLADLRTRVRYAHPWFGPLDAAGWYQLAAGHLGIHRVQIERIRAGLATERVRPEAGAGVPDRLPASG